MIMFCSNRFSASGGLEDHFPHNFMASKDPCPTFLWNPSHRNDASVILFLGSWTRPHYSSRWPKSMFRTNRCWWVKGNPVLGLGIVCIATPKKIDRLTLLVKLTWVGWEAQLLRSCFYFIVTMPCNALVYLFLGCEVYHGLPHRIWAEVVSNPT